MENHLADFLSQTLTRSQRKVFASSWLKIKVVYAMQELCTQPNYLKLRNENDIYRVENVG